MKISAWRPRVSENVDRHDVGGVLDGRVTVEVDGVAAGERAVGHHFPRLVELVMDLGEHHLHRSLDVLGGDHAVAVRADVVGCEEGVVGATEVVGEIRRRRGLLHVAGRAAVVELRVVAALADLHEVDVLAHEDVGLGAEVGRPILVGGLVPGAVVAQTAPGVVAGHADGAAADIGGGEAGEQLRRVAGDPDRGVVVVARDIAGGVRVVAGDAGLGVGLVLGPGDLDGIVDVAGVRSDQHREPGQEAVAGVALGAGSALALFDRELVVGVLGELPLLEAGVPEGLAVAGGAGVG